MTEEIKETALILLAFMELIGQAALAGDPIAQPYLDADAVRILDGKPAVHKERFLALMAKEIAEVATE